MSFLRELFWLSATYNFQLVAVHLPGKANVFADHVSRMHDLKMCEVFLRHMLEGPLYTSDLVHHMSSNTLRFLLYRLTGTSRDGEIG